MNEHYYPQTLQALQQHVNNFLYQLDELSNRAAGRDLKVHPRLPIILQHNEFVKQTFLNVKANLEQ